MFRKLIARLRHKYGPLPLWAWTAIAGAGVFLWNRYRSGPSEEEAAAPAFAPAYAFGEGEADYGDTGPGPVGAVGPAEDGGELYSDNKLREASMELIDQIRGISDELAQGGPPAAGGEEVVEPDRPDSIATPGKPPQPERGVRWYGREFTSKRGFAAELARRGYRGARNAAEAWREWARLHPDQARKIAGPAPKAPKRQPAKAPKRPSAHTPGREPAKGGRGGAGARARAPQRPPQQAQRPRTTPAKRQSPTPAGAPKPRPSKRRRGVIARLRRRR